MRYKVKRFSTKVLGTLSSGFRKDRNYDQDLNRLSKGKTSRELSKPNEFQKMKDDLKKELEESKKMIL